MIADSDGDALELARPAWREWFASLNHLWRAHGVRVPLPFTEDPDHALAAGWCLAGTASTVRDRLRDECHRAGVTYMLARFAFGGLPLDASLRSVRVFCDEVAPALASEVAV